jgi:hypothetical protein
LAVLCTGHQISCGPDDGVLWGYEHPLELDHDLATHRRHQHGNNPPRPRQRGYLVATTQRRDRDALGTAAATYQAHGCRPREARRGRGVVGLYRELF